MGAQGKVICNTYDAVPLSECTRNTKGKHLVGYVCLFEKKISFNPTEVNLLLYFKIREYPQKSQNKNQLLFIKERTSK